MVTACAPADTVPTEQITDVQAQWFRTSKPSEELFDVQADPYELRDLAAIPEYQEKLLALRAATDDWFERVDDLGALPEAEPVQQFWNGADEMPVTGRPQLRRDSTGRLHPGKQDGGGTDRLPHFTGG